LLPPVTLFQNAFHYGWIVATTDPELFYCLDPGVRRRSIRCLLIILHSIVKVCRNIVCLKNCRVELIVHSYFEGKDKVSRIKKLS